MSDIFISYSFAAIATAELRHAQTERRRRKPTLLSEDCEIRTFLFALAQGGQ